MENCNNCGRLIGNMETPFVFRERVVCKECHQRLTISTPVMVPSANLSRCATCGRPLASGATKCPSCGEAMGFDIGRFLLLLVFVLVVLWVLGVAVSSSST